MARWPGGLWRTRKVMMSGWHSLASPPRKRMSPKSAGSVTIVVERDIADDSRRINIACGASKPVEAVNVNRCPLDPAAVRSAAGEARRTTHALRSDVRGPAIEGPDPGSRSIPTVPQCRTTRRPTWCRRGASVGLTLAAVTDSNRACRRGNRFPGADVGLWPEADLPATPGDVCFPVKCGLNILAASISGFDPERTSWARSARLCVVAVLPLPRHPIELLEFHSFGDK